MKREATEKSMPGPIIGRVTYRSGETTDYDSAEEYLWVIREELPFRNTTGFTYETLTTDPIIRKAVDDELYDLFGETNPKRVQNYGLSEKGKDLLEKAANPDVPHIYSWFVIDHYNRPGETISSGLNQDEAMDQYRKATSGNTRLGVTMDEIATVDLLVTMEGETQLLSDYQNLAAFQNDPVVNQAAAVITAEFSQDLRGAGTIVANKQHSSAASLSKMCGQSM